MQTAVCSDFSPNKLVTMGRKESVWLPLLVLLSAGSLLRLFLLWRAGFVIESDEAIVGLMAKHIAEGASWPVFFYGQDYLGSLEAIVAAGVFSAFGDSTMALKSVPWFFSVLFIVVTYFLAKEVGSRRTALFAALFTAIPPLALAEWGVKARGGFIELLVIGSFSFYLAVKILKAKKISLSLVGELGLVLGLGWWINNQIIFYLLTIALFLGVYAWLREGLLKSLGYTLICAGAFIIGSAPFWYANFVSTPRFSSFCTLFGGTVSAVRGVEQESFIEIFWSHLVGFFAEALPIILGARPFWSDLDLYTGASLLTFIVYGLLLAYLCWKVVKAEDLSFKLVFGMLLAFPAAVGIIFSASSFGWLSKAPRYLLPLYSVIPLITALGVNALWRRGRGIIGFVAVIGILALNLSSGYFNSAAQLGQPFVYKGQRVERDQGPLYKWLANHNYRHILTNYWIGYRTAFETHEKVLFSLYRGPQSLRIPSYQFREIASSDYPAVYVLVPAQTPLVTAVLDELGYNYRVSRVGGYEIIDQVDPVSRHGRMLKLTAEDLRVTQGAERKSLLIDGNPGTRWGSGEPQKPGMIVETRFEARPITGFKIDLGFWRHDRPRGLRAMGQEPNGHWCELFSTEGLDIVPDTKDFIEVFMTPRKLQALRLEQIGKDPIFDWSIAELQIFENNE